MAQQRRIVSIEITLPARRTLGGLSEKHGMTQVAMMSRLLEWFSDQPHSMQCSVIGRFPKEVVDEAVRTMLKRMADGQSAV